MTQTIEQKTTLYDRGLNLWLEEAIASCSLIILFTNQPSFSKKTIA